MIVALPGRRRDDLDIDAHPVEIAQTPVDGGHHLVDIFFLTGIDRLGRVVGEVGQRDAADIDMRLRDLGGFRHEDMRMDIDGRRRRAAGAAIGVVDAGSRKAIAILRSIIAMSRSYC